MAVKIFSDSEISRRRFMQQAALAGAVAALPFGTKLAFGATGGQSILITVLLRGGMDGLKFLAPSDDAHYRAARPDGLRVLNTGPTAGLALANAPTAQDWRLNPDAAPLKALYDQKQLAFVHAAGLMADTRSHGQAITLIETGFSGGQSVGTKTGWLTRYEGLLGAGVPLAGVSLNDQPPPDWLNSVDVVAFSDPRNFKISGSIPPDFLRAAYGGAGVIQSAGTKTLSALDTVAAHLAGAPAASAEPSGPFAPLARLINLDLGVRAVTITYEGWDHHVSEEARFKALMSRFAKDLVGFWNAIPNFHNRVTLLTLSDFGRRLAANGDAGTDHGHGQCIMVLGGGIAGGKTYGRWPGLAPAALDQGDLAVTTDLRQIMWEIAAPSLPGRAAGDLFPGFVPTALPLGLVK